MANANRPTKLRVDSDGVRTIETPGIRPGVWLVIAALALLGTLIAFLRPSTRGGAAESVAPIKKAAPNVAASTHESSLSMKPPPPHRERVPVAQAPQPAVRLVPKPHEPIAPPPPAAVESEPAPEPAAAAPAPASQDQPATNDLGEDQPMGIAVFPPPGTKPILRGYVVPDTFEVPEGYVRHYQTTDRGHQLPPILLFHPDYQLLDPQGQPIQMPKDRVVPPELLPPGMPAQRLDLPEDGSEPPPDPSLLHRNSGGQDSPGGQDPQP